MGATCWCWRTVTAGRRADAAFPRFAASHGFDAIVHSSQPLPELGG